jgi:hypothetical protein
MNEDVSKVLFGFAQAIGFGEAPTADQPDFAAAITRISQHGTLKAESVLAWPASDRLAVRELVKAWLVTLEVAHITGNPVNFPPSFLDGCSSTRLGEKVVAEILTRNAQLQEIARGRTQSHPDRRN